MSEFKKREMLKVKKFASENLQEQVVGENIELETSEGAPGEYIEYISLQESNNSNGETVKMIRPEGNMEGEASLRHKEHPDEESGLSNGQESLNMSDLGLPSSFSQLRKGQQGEGNTFKCTLCDLTLTSVSTMKDHMNGKNHLKKSHALAQKNSEQILSVVAVSNQASTRLGKVLHKNHKKFLNVPFPDSHAAASNDKGDNRSCCGFGFCPGKCILSACFWFQPFMRRNSWLCLTLPWIPFISAAFVTVRFEIQRRRCQKNTKISIQ